MQKRQAAIDDEIQKEEEAWRDKLRQHEVKLYNELLSKDCEVTVIYLRINVIMERLMYLILFINDKYVSIPVPFLKWLKSIVMFWPRSRS